MRQIVLDTETTGLSPAQGHRVIEIGCLELIDRRLTGREFHCFLHPDREIEEAAQQVHGISLEDLETAPRFNEIAEEFLAFVTDAELVIHNAPFDIGFIDHELKLFGKEHNGQYQPIQNYCSVVDTLVMARQKHPGQKNNLDALCKRYTVDNSQRDLHGALLDAEILADVYLMMTGGQTALLLNENDSSSSDSQAQQIQSIRKLTQHIATPVIRATEEEEQAHSKKLETIAKISGGEALWKTS